MHHCSVHMHSERDANPNPLKKVSRRVQGNQVQSVRQMQENPAARSFKSSTSDRLIGAVGEDAASKVGSESSEKRMAPDLNRSRGIAGARGSP